MHESKPYCHSHHALLTVFYRSKENQKAASLQEQSKEMLRIPEEAAKDDFIKYYTAVKTGIQNNVLIPDSQKKHVLATAKIAFDLLDNQSSYEKTIIFEPFDASNLLFWNDAIPICNIEEVHLAPLPSAG